MAAVTPDLLITVSPYDTTGTPEPPGWLFSLMPPFSAIFFFFKSGIYLYCCKRSLPGFSPVLPLLCCQSSAPPNPRNHHCSCLEGRGLGGATGAMPEFALAAEKKGGWEYSGFNTFLMTKVLSLGTHDLLRQQHQKTVLFFALQKSWGAPGVDFRYFVVMKGVYWDL